MTSARTSEAMGRIPVRNAWHMLLYAWDMAAWRGRVPVDVEHAPSLLGLLARVLCAATRPLLRRGLGRAFVAEGETLRGVRGRIDFAHSLKRLEFEAVRAHCRFSRLGEDTPRNRILRGTLHRLAGDPRVDHVDARKAADLRHELHDLVRAMPNVTLAPVTKAAFSQLQLGRMDKPYALPLAICALLQRLEMPTECEGDHALTALARDEITFHSLFERFVRNFWRLRLTGWDVRSEVLDWFDELHSELVPSMRTDITLTKFGAPRRRIVVDTKYHTTTFAQGPHGHAKFKSENLYEIYAYLRTQEHRSPAHRDAEGLLLYPTCACDLDEAMLLQGHRIRVATVDLAMPWEEVEERLLALVDFDAQSAYATA